MNKNPKLSIGSATFDDFEGVYFTYQAIRLGCLDRLDEIDLLIIDNNPTSAEGKATEDFCNKAGIRYFAEPLPRSTAIRDLIFRNANAPFTMSIDPHVLFEPGTISRLIDHAEVVCALDSSDLFHGVMLYDYLAPGGECATHMDPRWRDNMFGTWEHDPRGSDPEADPWEIPMHGLGIFATKTDDWLGFSPLFQGFGGEEGYIHRKYDQKGRTTWVLPWLRWLHRFQRPRGNPYPLNIEERIRNYCFGWLETDQPLDAVQEHFEDTHPGLPVERIIADARRIWEMYLKNSKEALDLIHKPIEEKVVPFSSEAQEIRAKEKGVTLWHDTQVKWENPLQIEILGKILQIENASFKWSIR